MRASRLPPHTTRSTSPAWHRAWWTVHTPGSQSTPTGHTLWISENKPRRITRA
ncbi:predicted protein [Aspergillus terreus NIH2624]|uniref:Uncharacterized protein n=1 Tax=Aspergillus terreus (strain NIH 2624 / FGSC A1156) TaxID=341663 RepID=Q0CEG8_ASPTN|nr:uncharacterized protein ATEG_07916 [Aspergillus terreus NIH2624]EAU32178.1 predicted protein [Aspergillus terreus NIH2624]